MDACVLWSWWYEHVTIDLLRKTYSESPCHARQRGPSRHRPAAAAAAARPAPRLPPGQRRASSPAGRPARTITLDRACKDAPHCRREFEAKSSLENCRRVAPLIVILTSHLIVENASRSRDATAEAAWRKQNSRGRRLLSTHLQLLHSPRRTWLTSWKPSRRERLSSRTPETSRVRARTAAPIDSVSEPAPRD